MFKLIGVKFVSVHINRLIAPLTAATIAVLALGDVAHAELRGSFVDLSLAQKHVQVQRTLARHRLRAFVSWEVLLASPAMMKKPWGRMTRTLSSLKETSLSLVREN